MALFSIKSQSKEHALHAPEMDFRAARKVGPYRVGREAIYFPAFPGWRGLPYRAVERAWSKPASFNVTGCCGKALPMLRLRMFYDGAFYQDFLFERPTRCWTRWRRPGRRSPSNARNGWPLFCES